MITLIKPATRNLYNSVIVADPVSGVQDGVNKVYTTTYDYKSGHLSFMINGQSLHVDDDFLETGANEITLLHIAPYGEDVLRATYELNGSVVNPGSMISGKVALSVGDDTKYVTFPNTLTNANYKLNVDIVSDGSNPSVYSFVITDKSTTGFRVYFSGEIDSSDYFLEWSAT